jgi:hypothetical protein
MQDLLCLHVGREMPVILSSDGRNTHTHMPVPEPPFPSSRFLRICNLFLLSELFLFLMTLRPIA